MDESSGVGVVDKTVALIDAVAAGALPLADLSESTGIPRATAHRLAVALEHHGVLMRDEFGRFTLGPRTARWAAGLDEVRAIAEEAVHALRDATGLSAQAYRRIGDQRLCVAAAEPPSGLRDTVPVGSLLTLSAGSGAQVLVAWLDEAERARLLVGAAYDEAELATVRRRGWAHSVGQRADGVASISAPIRGAEGGVVLAISVSGPADRLAKPSASLREALLAEVGRLSA